jgi:phosphatidate phosphatase LPIN
MQYVRNLSDSVSTAWNSINPATLSGAIDVIVIEQDDGTLMCSPFHVRFGKFSLLRPSEKKVEFKVNGAKQDYAMKLGDGGEAFFVFETSDTIPQALQTSPLASPVSSPSLSPTQSTVALSDTDPFELDGDTTKPQRPALTMVHPRTIPIDNAPSIDSLHVRASSGGWGGIRPHSDNMIQKSTLSSRADNDTSEGDGLMSERSERSHSPPPMQPSEAYERAMALSRELSAANIPTHVTSSGDLMLDMTGFKSNDEDAFQAEILARRVLSEERDDNFDVGSLFGMDDQGNLWIYSSQDAKEAAMKKTLDNAMGTAIVAADAASDPGYQSDGSDHTIAAPILQHRRADSDVGTMELGTMRPNVSRTAGDPNRNYAKTLRLTSDQLKALKLKPGENSMSFTVNRATCQAFMYLWKSGTPVVISDIDGTITKSDALGHVLNMIGRDWTHAGVAKLYSDISANGYNIMYLTSRSVGQTDNTRAYLSGIVQDGYRLPRGPTILSPDRTMAALRREIYLRKPHVFKMATLRDIRSLYPAGERPFSAGFGNRLTDQISYRTVDVPRHRIFTINSNAEVAIDVMSLNKLKLSYVNINEVVDHYFPPVSTLVQGGSEEFTDFTYWRDAPLDLDDFSASESEDEGEDDDDLDDEHEDDQGSEYADDEDEEDLEDDDEGLADSFMSRGSIDDSELRQSLILDGNGEDNDEDEEEDDVDGQDELAESMLREQEAILDAEEAVHSDQEEDVHSSQEEDATPAVEQVPYPPSSPNKALKPQDHVVVRDIGAELITGVGGISLE